jgi:TRAP transporter TAXI family solute receptor
VKSSIFSGALLLALAPALSSLASPSPIVIASGPVAGFAYPLAGEICRLYEKETNGKGHCTVAVSDGSVDDVKRLRDGAADLAVVQSDVAADALAATGPFTGSKPFPELRAVTGFYGQILTILVKSDGPVKSVDDLKGKRVAAGEPGAADPLFADFLEAEGWSKADLGGLAEMPRADQVAALCSGGVAAIAITAPHPNGFIRSAMAACNLTALDLAGPAIDAAVAEHPAYGPAKLELGVYGGASHVVQSFGTRAVLVTTVKLDDDVVKHLLKAVIDHAGDLRAAHPAFAGLDEAALSSGSGLGVDRHPAAAKYLSGGKGGDPGSGGG